MAEVAPEVGASALLLPALTFASRNEFANLQRLRGVEALVDGVLKRATVDDGLASSLREAARGFDDVDDGAKRARISRMIALLKPTLPVARPAPLARRAPTAAPNDPLSWPVTRLKGTGPQRALALADRGLKTVGDVVFTLPRTYEDRRTQRKISELEDGLLAVISGTVVASGVVGGGRGRRYEAVIDDGSAQLRLIFFHFRLPELQKRLARGEVVTASGDVKRHGGRLSLIHPRLTSGDLTSSAGQGLGGVKPVYPELQGLHPLELARVAAAAVDVVKRGVPDPLPPDVVVKAQLPALHDALVELHAPAPDITVEELRALLDRRSSAHRRLAFEELFVLGTALSLRRRSQAVDPAPPLRSRAGEDDAVSRLLPFALTAAQRRAVDEVLADLEKAAPMGRLLQGDVGSGKTAVAAIACLRAARAGHQAAFMAPTEILAEQHGRTLKKIGFAAGLRVEVLTGSLGKKARALLESRIANRDVDVVVGTQALLSEGVRFFKLGLCIVDEQHRFGVVQRALLRTKGPIEGGVSLTPHLLVMTATPIPRSLTLTVYGDLAVSVLDELPPGRTAVATKLVGDLNVAVDAIEATLAGDERAFVVYPLIDESEKLDLQAASAGFQDLKAKFGDDVGLLHGKLPTSEKDAAMNAFARGDKRVLVSTTVVEVGVDVPAATLMVIVCAERFGLAQLHQLRGRVGRSARASSCILVAADPSPDALDRLRTLEQTNDGFVIAQKDLELRGPGDVLGTRQSGLPTLAFSDLVRHAALIELARTLADDVVADDPHLQEPEHAGLRKLVWERYAERLALTAAG